MKNNAVVSILKRIKHSLIINRYEPKIVRKSDRYGNRYWQVSDLRNDRSHTFGSEQDVRVWLENRHYHFN